MSDRLSDSALRLIVSGEAVGTSLERLMAAELLRLRAALYASPQAGESPRAGDSIPDRPEGPQKHWSECRCVMCCGCDFESCACKGENHADAS